MRYLGPQAGRPYCGLCASRGYVSAPGCLMDWLTAAEKRLVEGLLTQFLAVSGVLLPRLCHHTANGEGEIHVAHGHG